MMRFSYHLWLVLVFSFLLSLSVSRVGAETQMVITPVEIPLSAPEIPNPLRGFYDWQSAGVQVPNLQYSEFYKRYMWDELETSTGIYDFSVIKKDLAKAKAKRQKFAFRVMAVNSFHSDQEGVPDYLISEVPGSYCSYEANYPKLETEQDRVWVPDWNSQAFLDRAKSLTAALGQEFDGDIEIAYYEMGLYGHWGEWHAYPFTNCSTAGEAREATKQTIIDMQLSAFPKSRIIMNSGAATSNSFAYTLKKSPRIGIRIDSFNWPWFDQQIRENPTKKAWVKSRWKTAPIIVEFGGCFGQNDSKDFSLARAQVNRWHLASLANGNSYAWDSLTQVQKDNFQMAGKLSGYRFVPKEFSYPNVVSRNRMQINSLWSNKGVTPLYETFIVRYTLSPKGQNTVAWQGDSMLDLPTLLPTVDAQRVDTPKAVSDTFILPPTLAAGNYTLKLSVVDSGNYRPNLALAIEGRSSDGFYTIGDIEIR